jgi:PBSX family phage terminase large subunit
MNLTPKQGDFFTSKAPATAFVTGFGGGKSYILTGRMLVTKLQYPTVDLLYTAPTFSLIRDVLFPLVDEIMGETGMKYKINRSDNDIIFPGRGKILCRSMDDPGKLIGFTIGDAFLDELDTLPTEKARNIWNKCLGRMRKKFPDGKRNQIWASTTPEGYKFMWEMFEKEPPEGYKLVRGSTYDNPHLPDGFIDNMRASYPPELVEAYINGQFVNLSSGAVYKHYNPDLHGTDLTMNDFPFLFVGQDFNFDGCVSVLFGEAGDTLHIVGEALSEDTYEVAEYLKSLKKPVIIFPDASGSKKTTNAKESDISILKKSGFRVKALSKNPPVQDRVNSVNGLFCQNRLFVNRHLAKETHSALLQQCYDENTGSPEKNHRPGSVDDYTDPVGYCCHSKYPLKTRRVYRTAVRGL